MKICVARPSLPAMPRWKLEFAKATPLTTDHLSMARHVNCVGTVDRGTKMVLFRASERNQGMIFLTLKLTIQQKDQLSDLILFSHAIFNGFAGVQHRTMIAATECIANLVERSLGVTPRQIHRHL